MLEDTYVDMEIALPRDVEGPKFSKLIKRMLYENVIPIGRQHDDPIIDTRVYGVDYLDVHKASLAANTIAENLFSIVDEDSNRFVIFDDIVDHLVNGIETMQQDAFIMSKNGGKRQSETTKVWEILIQWKYGSMTWDIMKYVK